MTSSAVDFLLPSYITNQKNWVAPPFFSYEIMDNNKVMWACPQISMGHEGKWCAVDRGTGDHLFNAMGKRRRGQRNWGMKLEQKQPPTAIIYLSFEKATRTYRRGLNLCNVSTSENVETSKNSHLLNQIFNGLEFFVQILTLDLFCFCPYDSQTRWSTTANAFKYYAPPQKMDWIFSSGWWCNNNLYKYESQREGWHPIYEMGNKSHVWNHQPANDFAGTLWLWLTVCHGKIHPFVIGKTNQN